MNTKHARYEIDQCVPLMKGDDDSDHIADCILRFEDSSVQDFVTGAIENERHHLFLNGWYRVMTNLELPNPGDSQLWD